MESSLEHNSRKHSRDTHDEHPLLFDNTTADYRGCSISKVSSAYGQVRVPELHSDMQRMCGELKRIRMASPPDVDHRATDAVAVAVAETPSAATATGGGVDSSYRTTAADELELQGSHRQTDPPLGYMSQDMSGMGPSVPWSAHPPMAASHSIMPNRIWISTRSYHSIDTPQSVQPALLHPQDYANAHPNGSLDQDLSGTGHATHEELATMAIYTPMNMQLNELRNHRLNSRPESLHDVPHEPHTKNSLELQYRTLQAHNEPHDTVLDNYRSINEQLQYYHLLRSRSQ
ncbi:hypothetical protein BSLG_002126 [Batrachochytrium salamandrivorans]|nr:hypothetical protein BASA62_008590 [Batrachochytrium salamandrivorans]KAH6575630.1 hypothetical protein BASA60_004933 [Batrachochytrium salamandrivorans]KAH9274207.1 hypothetical protein BASA83_003514 [Batrachochytrium salamandrivorans]KAJ1343100.1 hypothetical protein BSLG_002126 [Batrachochytrium salamandrivorans]